MAFRQPEWQILQHVQVVMLGSWWSENGQIPLPFTKFQQRSSPALFKELRSLPSLVQTKTD